MELEHKNPARPAAQSQPEMGKSMSPPPFQLKASEGEGDGVMQQFSLGGVVSAIGDWFSGLFNPQGNGGAGTQTAGQGQTQTADGQQAESPVAEQQQTQTQTNATDAQPAEQTREERVSELLQAHYDGFAVITVNVPNPNPQAVERTLPCEVRPPYMINSGTRITNAATNRAANRRVNALLNTFSWGFRHGKASASDIQSFLQQAIDQGLTTNNTSAGLRTFLETYGVGVDCSGFSSQGYNMLLQELGLEGDAFDVNNTGSGSFRDAHARFTAVASPRDLKPGDAQYIDNPRGIDHVRLVQNVTVNDTSVVFVTIESAGGTTNGPRQKHWRFTDPASFDSLQGSADGGATYTDSTENPEFARFDELYPEEEEGAETETQQTEGQGPR